VGEEVVTRRSRQRQRQRREAEKEELSEDKFEHFFDKAFSDDDYINEKTTER
jgi:hypothetical protein